MSNKVYKYFSSDILPLAFQRKGYCGIKCSFPRNYNDPYELFLGVDLTVSPQLLAYYNDIIQKLPQHPTTCFSKSPTVAPMWAHYANNHTGFILEFDVHQLTQSFKGTAIHEIIYRDNPDERIKSYLQRAAGTKKPRHAYFLQQAVLGGAYFSKHTAWSYEEEVRLVDDSENCENIGTNKILFVPNACISSIIIGQNFPDEALNLSVKLAEANDLQWYRSIIGKSKAEPFFKDRFGGTATFDGHQIVPAKRACKSCSEPVDENRDLCPWCSITEIHEINAARGSPLRMLDRYGLLERYYEEASKVGRST